ncbi:hypothetical protein LCGC14_2656830, partial [marine sediment metagenome]
AKAFIIYRYEHALKREGKESLTYSSENIPYKKLWLALSWGVDNECVLLSHIKKIIEEGRFGELVRVSEEFYRGELNNATRAIMERINELKIIIVSGPSSSGKTTTTTKVGDYLKKQGYSLVTLNVDNYYFDLKDQPQDTNGDYDYETPQAIDLELLSRHMRDLLNGETVRIPYYNFKTGNREGISRELSLGEKDILLIVIRIVMAIIGIGAAYLSMHYTRMWLLEFLSPFLSTLLSSIMILFSVASFETIPICSGVLQPGSRIPYSTGMTTSHARVGPRRIVSGLPRSGCRVYSKSPSSPSFKVTVSGGSSMLGSGAALSRACCRPSFSLFITSASPVISIRSMNMPFHLARESSAAFLSLAETGDIPLVTPSGSGSSPSLRSTRSNSIPIEEPSRGANAIRQYSLTMRSSVIFSFFSVRLKLANSSFSRRAISFLTAGCPKMVPDMS